MTDTSIIAPSDGVSTPDSSNHNVADAVSESREDGIAVCVVPSGEKAPRKTGWNTKSAEPDDFRDGDNVGIQCGPLSDCNEPGYMLICVDLDSPEARTLASEHLPDTDMREGRQSSPDSHLYYLAPVDSVPRQFWAKPEGVAARAFTDAGKHPGARVIRFKRVDGRKGGIDFMAALQVIAPPSTHPSRERRKWAGGRRGKPAKILFLDLLRRTIRLAEVSGCRVTSWVTKALAEIDAETQPSDQVPTHADTFSKNIITTLGRLDSVIPADIAGVFGSIKGVETPFIFTPSVADKLRRALLYVDAIPAHELPRTGHCGHNTLFKILSATMGGFDERQNAVFGRAVAAHVNVRIRSLAAAFPNQGYEEWSDAEIDHKLTDVMRATPPPDKPDGYLLARDDGVPRAWSDAERLGEEYLKGHCVRCVRDSVFRFNGVCYVPLSDSAFKATVRVHISRRAVDEYRRLKGLADAEDAQIAADERAADDERNTEQQEAKRAAVERRKKQAEKGKPKGPPSFTRETVGNVSDTIRAKTQLADDTAFGTWIDERAGETSRPLIVANGSLDLRALTLSPHTSDFFALTALLVEFAPNAPPPAKWLAIIGQLMCGDPDRVAVIQEIFGACLDPHLRIKFFAAFVGGGDNGKSVVLNVLRAMLGTGNVAAVDLADLTTNRFASYALLGKLANVVGDQGHFDSHDEGRLKTLTGGDLVSYERKGHDPLFAENMAKFVFACNRMPTFSDRSDAVWNRLVAVPFDYRVPAADKNPQLLTHDYWAVELSGILNWAISGLHRLYTNGRFTKSAACDELAGRHRLESNPAAQFLNVVCVEGTEHDAIATAELYAQYREWCDRNGFKYPLTSPVFGREVSKRFPAAVSAMRSVKNVKARAWYGIRPVATESGSSGNFARLATTPAVS